MTNLFLVSPRPVFCYLIAVATTIGMSNISVPVPCFNEEAARPELFERLGKGN